MDDDYGPQIRIPIDEVDDWVKDACAEYGPEGLVLDDVASIDLKTTKLRGKSKIHALTMIFHVDHQEEVFFVAMDINKKQMKLKCLLKEWRGALEEKQVTHTK
jgi:hypothetical protein